MILNISRTYILLLCLVSLVLHSCNKEDSSSEDDLKLISQWPVSIPETSGLASYHFDYFLTVSDSLSTVYLINRNGETVKTLNYIGENTEGIAYNLEGTEIFIVEENTNEVVQLDTNGQIVNRFAVELDNKIERHGLEGISYNPNNEHLYVISEKLPSLLFELTKNGTVLNTHEIKFAEDFSSVYYDSNLNKLWILSDDSKTLTRCNLQGNWEQTWNTGIKKGEGVVVDSNEERIYIISDGDDNQLYIFSF